MANVKVKKSVLESLIKKSLFESEDVSEKLLMKPDASNLPSELPLKADNLITDQPELETPPVDDEEYSPANEKELGSAMKELTKSISSEKAGEAYKAIKKTLEQFQNSEGNMSESKLRRELVKQFLKEADDYKYDDDFDDEDFSDDDLGDEEEDEIESPRQGRTVFSDQELEMFAPFYSDLNDRAQSDVIDALETIFLGSESSKDFENLKKVMSARARLFDLKTSKKSLAVDSRNEPRVRGIVNYTYEQLKEFILTMKKQLAMLGKQTEIDRSSKEGVIYQVEQMASEVDDELVKIDQLMVDKSGQWRQLKTTFGYGAESGIRQGTIKDILGVRGVQQIWTDEFKDDLVDKIDRAWYECIKNPINAKFFAALLSDEENGYKELFRLFTTKKGATLEFLKKESLIYRNFMGILTYQISGKIADMKFGQPQKDDTTPGRYLNMLNSNKYLTSGKRSLEDVQDIFNLKASNKLNDRQLKTFFKFLKLTPDVNKILKKIESPNMTDDMTAQYVKDIATKADSFSAVEPGRDITLAFQSDFPENKPISDEEREILEKMLIDEGGLENAVDEVLEASAEDDHRGTFTGAAILSGQDITAEDAAWAEQEADVNIKHPAIYEEPAFASFKKAAGAGKNPDYLMKQMLDPKKIPGADKNIEAVKGSLKDINKAKKAAEKAAAEKSAKMKR